MSLPKPLQHQMDEDARIAAWREAEKKKACENAERVSTVDNVENGHDVQKPVKLRKDGTPMKKRGPKPKAKKIEGGVGAQVVSETLNVPAVREPVIAKKPGKPRKPTVWEEKEAKNNVEQAIASDFAFLKEYFSDEFLEHCFTLLRREKTARKKASE